MVATVSLWHPDHEAAVREWNRRRSAGETVALATQTLFETYSVLTRFPPPYRVPPGQAVEALEATFVDPAQVVVALDADIALRLLHAAPAASIRGGLIYDAIIVECATAAGAETILTFNDRHFRALAPDRISIVRPQ
jgi:predicted nucleic acid-binding protein